MVLYRISSKLHARDLSGTGAALYGGRWNPKGLPMLYTSEHVSLAALEIVANLSSGHFNNHLYLSEIYFPDHLGIEEPAELPDGWNSFPHRSSTVSIGRQFLESGGFCLKVPSAIISSEFNFLLNPLHGDFNQVGVVNAKPMILDHRLFMKR